MCGTRVRDKHQPCTGEQASRKSYQRPEPGNEMVRPRQKRNHLPVKITEGLAEGSNKKEAVLVEDGERII